MGLELGLGQWQEKGVLATHRGRLLSLYLAKADIDKFTAINKK